MSGLTPTISVNSHRLVLLLAPNPQVASHIDLFWINPEPDEHGNASHVAQWCVRDGELMAHACDARIGAANLVREAANLVREAAPGNGIDRENNEADYHHMLITAAAILEQASTEQIRTLGRAAGAAPLPIE